MLSAYLQELERELACSLPADDVRTRLAESEAHLREGVAGRIELGMDRVEAEREAISAFGAARRIGRADPSARRGRATARLLWLSSGYLLAILFVTVGQRYIEALPRLSEWLFQSWFVFGVGFAVAAFVARRPRPLAIGLTTLSATTATWLILGTTYLNLGAFGGGGLLATGDASSQIASVLQTIAERSKEQATFEAGWAVIRGPQGIGGLHTAKGYRAPVVQPVVYRAPVEYETVPDAKAALDAWSDVRRRGAHLFETESLTINLRAAERAKAAPVLSLLSIAPDIFVANLGVASLAILVDYLFGGLGTLVYRLRDRRRRTLV